MTGQEYRPSPATVAPLPGAEAAKLMQRFAILNPENQGRILDMALGLIERQEDEKLPPREREIKRLIDSIERHLELIETRGNDCEIAMRVWRGVMADDQRRLAAMGVNYFGPSASPSRSDAA